MRTGVNDGRAEPELEVTPVPSPDELAAILAVIAARRREAPPPEPEPWRLAARREALRSTEWRHGPRAWSLLRRLNPRDA